MQNVTTGKGILEGSPRWAQLSERTGANKLDTAWGFTYAEYAGTANYYAIVKAYGGSTAKLYVIDAATNAWTASTIAVGLTASDWFFTQYEGNLYAGNATDGLFFFSITAGPDDAANGWKELNPEYHLFDNVAARMLRPSYPTRAWNAGDTLSVTSNDSPDVIFNADALLLEVNGGYVYQGSYVRWFKTFVKFNSVLDLTDVDFIGFTLTPRAADGCIIAPNHSMLPLEVRYSTAGSPTYAASIALPIQYDNPAKIGQNVNLSGIGDPANSKPVHVWVDVRGLPTATKSAITAIGIGFVGEFGSGNAFHVNIGQLLLGGADMLDIGPGPNISILGSSNNAFLEYAYTYYNPGTGAEKGAVKLQIPITQVKGTSLSTDVPPKIPEMGGWVEITAPSTSFGGYTSARIYRNLGGTWYRIAEVDATVDVDYIDKLRGAALKSLPKTLLTFGNVSASIPPSALAFWKSHLCISNDRKLYMSWGGRPSYFMPSPDDVFTAVSENDTSQGRTLYIDHARAQTIISIGAMDNLYLVTGYGIFSMVGDSALTATPPRLMANSRGALGSRSALGYRGGVLVGASDSLWFAKASRYATAPNDGADPPPEEITSTVRTSWSNLTASSSSSTIILDELDILWAFCGSKYMRLTRPNPIDGTRRWEEGTWGGSTKTSATPDNLAPSVKAAHYHVTYGLKFLSTNGKLCKLSSAYTTDNGTTATWTYTTGILDMPRGRITQIKMQGSGTPNVAVQTWDGARTPTTESLNFTKASGRVAVLKKNTMAGYRHQLTITGTVGVDSIEELTMTYETIGAGGAN